MKVNILLLVSRMLGARRGIHRMRGLGLAWWGTLLTLIFSIVVIVFQSSIKARASGNNIDLTDVTSPSIQAQLGILKSIQVHMNGRLDTIEFKIENLTDSFKNHEAVQGMGKYPEKLAVLESEMTEIKWIVRCTLGGMVSWAGGIFLIGMRKGKEREREKGKRIKEDRGIGYE